MKTDMKLYRNRYMEIKGVAKDSGGNVMSIASPVKLIFKMVNLLDPTKHLLKTTDDPTEIAKTDAPAGKYTIYIGIADTIGLPAGEYRYEIVYVDDPASPVEVYTPNPKTIEQGILELKDTLIEVS